MHAKCSQKCTIPNIRKNFGLSAQSEKIIVYFLICGKVIFENLKLISFRAIHTSFSYNKFYIIYLPILVSAYLFIRIRVLTKMGILKTFSIRKKKRELLIITSLTFWEVMNEVEVSGEHRLLLHQISTESALPGLVAVRRLVRFPALVVHKGHAA